MSSLIAFISITSFFTSFSVFGISEIFAGIEFKADLKLSLF